MVPWHGMQSSKSLKIPQLHRLAEPRQRAGQHVGRVAVEDVHHRPHIAALLPLDAGLCQNRG